MATDYLADNPNFTSVPCEALRHELSCIDGPIIEVGGTTKELIDPSILPYPPITTDLNQFPHKSVDIVADGKNLPFPDNSLALVLANHIGICDNYDEAIRKFIKGNGTNGQAYRQQQVDQLAREEYRKFLDNPDAKIRYNLRIQFMQEMTRVVRPGGLVVFGALNELDTQVADQLGWQVADMFGIRQLPEFTHVFNVIFRLPK